MHVSAHTCSTACVCRVLDTIRPFHSVFCSCFSDTFIHKKIISEIKLWEGEMPCLYSKLYFTFGAQYILWHLTQMGISQTWWEELGVYWDMGSNVSIIDDLCWELSNYPRGRLTGGYCLPLTVQNHSKGRTFFFLGGGGNKSLWIRTGLHMSYIAPACISQHDMHISSKVTLTKFRCLTWKELFGSAHKLPVCFRTVILKNKYCEENWFFISSLRGVQGHNLYSTS